MLVADKIANDSLPSNLRFLITARPEDDILTALPPGPHIVRKQMGDIPEHIINGDIERFIRHSLQQYTELESSWPNGSGVDCSSIIPSISSSGPRPLAISSKEKVPLDSIHPSGLTNSYRLPRPTAGTR